MGTAVAAVAMSLFLVTVPTSSPAGPPVSENHVRTLSGIHAGQEDLAAEVRDGLEERGAGGAPHAESRMCDRCHRPCSDCHRSATGRFFFSARRATGNQPCLGCHAGWGAFPGTASASLAGSVHFASGMTCGTCHLGMSLSDGSAPGDPPPATTIPCEGCHAATLGRAEHAIHLHGGKLACGSCHAAEVASSLGVELDSLLGDEVEVSTPVSDWIFLLNAGGKISPANIRTFRSTGGPGVVVFVPAGNHVLLRRGRDCGDCHATFVGAEAARAGCVKLTWREEGILKNLSRVIPVTQGTAYEIDCREDTEDCGGNPVVVFAGGGSPLTGRQMEKLAIPRAFPVQSLLGDSNGEP